MFTERAIIINDVGATAFQRFRHVGGRLNHLTGFTGVGTGDNQQFFAPANACTMTSIFVFAVAVDTVNRRLYCVSMGNRKNERADLSHRRAIGQGGDNHPDRCRPRWSRTADVWHAGRC